MGVLASFSILLSWVLLGEVYKDQTVQASMDKFNLATTLLIEGDLKNAGSLFHESIQENPRINPKYIKIVNQQFNRAYNEKGRVSLARNDADEAISLYKTAISYYPYNENSYINMGAALTKTGQHEEAISLYS